MRHCSRSSAVAANGECDCPLPVNTKSRLRFLRRSKEREISHVWPSIFQFVPRLDSPSLCRKVRHDITMEGTDNEESIPLTQPIEARSIEAAFSPRSKLALTWTQVDETLSRPVYRVDTIHELEVDRNSQSLISRYEFEVERGTLRSLKMRPDPEFAPSQLEVAGSSLSISQDNEEKNGLIDVPLQEPITAGGRFVVETRTRKSREALPNQPSRLIGLSFPDAIEQRGRLEIRSSSDVAFLVRQREGLTEEPVASSLDGGISGGAGLGISFRRTPVPAWLRGCASGPMDPTRDTKRTLGLPRFHSARRVV